MSSEFSQVLFFGAIIHWKKVAVLAVAGLLGAGYCAGRAVTSDAPPAPNAALVETVTQDFFNLSAKQAFATLGMSPSKDKFNFGKTPACGDDKGSAFVATTSAGKSVEGTVCVTKDGKARITIAP